VLPEDLQKRGRILVCDNYFPTLALIQWVKDISMHILATIQAQRFAGANWVLPLKAKRGTLRVISQKDLRKK
jgi:hypothetical protein